MRATTLRKLALGHLAVLAALLGAGVCRADDAQELEQAKNRFDAGQYQKAHEQLAVLLDASLPGCDRGPSGACRLGDPDLVERARVFDVASLVALKRNAEADVQIEKVLRENPGYAPNPVLFPQEVVDRFSEVHGRIKPDLDRIAEQRAKDALRKRLGDQKAHDLDEAWIAELQRLAGQQKRVELNSRWVAMLPLGIGQYQNGSLGLGALFTVGEVLIGATSIASAVVVSNYYKFDRSRCDKVCYQSLNDNIAAATLVNRISFGALIGATIAGIVQAQIGFVPERGATFVPQPVPPRPKVAPTLTAGPGGFGIGLVGRF
jgi:hypothetical protein